MDIAAALQHLDPTETEELDRLLTADIRWEGRWKPHPDNKPQCVAQLMKPPWPTATRKQLLAYLRNRKIAFIKKICETASRDFGPFAEHPMHGMQK